MEKQEILNKIIDTLNDAFEADPNAIQNILCNQVQANQRLADHPTVVVGSAPHNIYGNETYRLTALGLINGIATALTGKEVAVKWSDTPNEKTKMHTILGFCEYVRPTEEVSDEEES